jgi:tetratricopeptide (TPR) repeat protein
VPLFLSFSPAIPINALLRRDHAKASDGFRPAIQIDPDWTLGYIKRARSLALQKKCGEAIEQAGIAEHRIAGGVGVLSRPMQPCGDTVRARQKLAELNAFAANRYVDPATLAEIYASLGEIEEAVHWYQKAYDDRSPDMVFAQVGGRLDTSARRQRRLSRAPGKDGVSASAR